ncbi:pathogen-associated molecular patterns-induced protein A70-like [Oryza glaberrima]|nr:pathogen-associated molecular patterns-induced protein A70-like [Oryza glaberrima]
MGLGISNLSRWVTGWSVASARGGGPLIRTPFLPSPATPQAFLPPIHHPPPRAACPQPPCIFTTHQCTTPSRPTPSYTTQSHPPQRTKLFPCACGRQNVRGDLDEMDVAADATAWPPGWSLVRGYFSPATLFLLLNVVIGTIALTSRASHRRRQHHHDEHYKAQHHHDHHDEPQRCHDQYAPPPPAPLERTSSVMERLRSFGLYRFRSGDFPPEYNLSAAGANAICDESEKQQAQYTRSRSEPAARPAPPPVEKRGKAENAAAAGAARAKVAVKKSSSSEVRKLERAPAQAQRQVLQVQRAQPPPPRAPAPAPARAVMSAAREEVETAQVGLATASSVDARADDFINKFREQLQLQRLNSLLNYNEMLNRGT